MTQLQIKQIKKAYKKNKPKRIILFEPETTLPNKQTRGQVIKETYNISRTQFKLLLKHRLITDNPTQTDIINALTKYKLLRKDILSKRARKTPVRIKKSSQSK